MASLVQEFQDGRSFDPGAVRRITQEWVDSHMKEKEPAFTESKAGHIFCGTWNVNGKKQEGTLNDWLLPPGNSELADIYAVGFQEMVDLNAMNVAIDGGKAQQRSQFWGEKISESLESTGTKFTMVTEKHLVGLLILIYVKTAVANKVKDVRATATGVGLLGMMGNKGAVAVRFNYYDSAICIVCSHLAAHRGAIVARNSDVKNITERSIFAAEFGGAETDAADTSSDSLVVRPRHGADKTKNEDLTILDHEFVFWIGDLNYRIDEELSTDEVFQLIEANKLEYLRSMDQLNIERAKGNVFTGFTEGALEFAPTYKYQPGTDDYDRRPEKKIRPPAWCDRILWRAPLDNASARLLSYRRSELNPSDHKPVSASFQLDLRVVIAEQEQRAYQELMKSLSLYRNSDIPIVEVDVGEGFSPAGGSSSQPMDFLGVRFMVKAELPYKIRNTGKSIAHWRFVNKIEESRFCKRWVDVSVGSGLLMPGEGVTIKITILIDKATAQSVNTGKERLTDMLILRVENSYDMYTPIEVEYMRSSYGMTLEELVMSPGAVRRTMLPAHRRAGEEEVEDEKADAQKLGIPKELWRLVDALWNGKALLEKDLFQGTHDESEVAAIREALDTGVDFPPNCTPHAYVEAMTTFLASLAKPIIAADLYPNVEVDETTQKQLCKRFLDALPPLSYNVLVYVVSFMREVLAQNGYNRSTPDRLSSVCVSSLTSQDDDKEDTRRATRINALRDLLGYLLTTSSL